MVIIHKIKNCQNAVIASFQDFAHHKTVKFHEIITYYLTTCVP
jgi:hypothetical protein